MFKRLTAQQAEDRLLMLGRYLFVGGLTLTVFTIGWVWLASVGYTNPPSDTVWRLAPLLALLLLFVGSCFRAMMAGRRSLWGLFAPIFAVALALLLFFNLL